MTGITYRLAQLICLCTLWLLLVNACPAQGLVEKVDEYLKENLEQSHLSGEVLIARDGKVLLMRSYGLANVENAVPNTPQTKFRLGSLTKQFTAMATMMLQERGALRVQDSICKYLPQCPAGWQGITIHHLLTHTSGMPDADYTETILLPMSVTNTIEHLKSQPLMFEPGRAFRYSNANYVLLGYIIEKASGQSYASFIREKIFEPLGMKDSGYDDQRSILPHRANGYSLRGETVVNAAYVDMSLPFSAGGLYSTIEDMSKWDQAFSTEKLVSGKSLAAIFTPDKNVYGYGWYIAERFGRRYINHSGWIEGFANAIARFPEEKLTVIILSNQDGATVNTLARNLAGLVMGARQEAAQGHHVVHIDPRLLDAYVGQYELAATFIITITKEGDHLMAQATGRPKLELFPESNRKFFVKEYDAGIVFVENSEGRVTHSILSLNGRDAEAKKIK
jgi:CubicO group peptidase (beta-lactamase class C family)